MSNLFLTSLRKIEDPDQIPKSIVIMLKADPTQHPDTPADRVLRVVRDLNSDQNEVYEDSRVEYWEVHDTPESNWYDRLTSVTFRWDGETVADTAVGIAYMHSELTVYLKQDLKSAPSPTAITKKAAEVILSSCDDLGENLRAYIAM